MVKSIVSPEQQEQYLYPILNSWETLSSVSREDIYSVSEKYFSNFLVRNIKDIASLQKPISSKMIKQHYTKSIELLHIDSILHSFKTINPFTFPPRLQILACLKNLAFDEMIKQHYTKSIEPLCLQKLPRLPLHGNGRNFLAKSIKNTMSIEPLYNIYSVTFDDIFKHYNNSITVQRNRFIYDTPFFINGLLIKVKFKYDNILRYCNESTPLNINSILHSLKKINPFTLPPRLSKLGLKNLSFDEMIKQHHTKSIELLHLKSSTIPEKLS